MILACLFLVRNQIEFGLHLEVYLGTFFLYICIYVLYKYHGRRRSDWQDFRLPENPTSYHGSPRTYTWNTCSRESQKFQTSFQLSTRSPHRPKDVSGKLIDLEIQNFEVWSLPLSSMFLACRFLGILQHTATHCNTSDHESSSFDWQTITAHLSYMWIYLLIYMHIFINMSLACLILDRQRIVCWYLCIQMHTSIHLCVYIYT